MAKHRVDLSEQILRRVLRDPGIKQADLCSQLLEDLGAICGSSALVARISKMAQKGVLTKEGRGKGRPVYLYTPGVKAVAIKRPPAGETKQSIRNELLRYVETVARDYERDDSSFHVLTLPGIEGVTNPHSFENQMLLTYPNLHVLGLENHKPTWDAMSAGMTFLDTHFSILRMGVDQYVQRASSVFDVVFLDYCGAADAQMIKSWRTLLNQEMLGSPAIFAVTLCASSRAARLNRASLGGNDAHYLRKKIEALVEAAPGYRSCRKLFLRDYSNAEVSRQSQDMMVGAFLIK